MKLVQKTLADVKIGDMGKKVVVIDGGNSFVGTLSELIVYGPGSFGSKETSINLKAKSSTGSGELVLRSLPQDFVIQMEDDSVGEAD